MTQCGGEATSTGGEVTPGREKGGDDVSWADMNLSKSKNKKNSYDRFNYFKWTVKI
jgi:hypothetical protein